MVGAKPCLVTRENMAFFPQKKRVGEGKSGSSKYAFLFQISQCSYLQSQPLSLTRETPDFSPPRLSLYKAKDGTNESQHTEVGEPDLCYMVHVIKHIWSLRKLAKSILQIW